MVIGILVLVITVTEVTTVKFIKENALFMKNKLFVIIEKRVDI